MIKEKKERPFSLTEAERSIIDMRTYDDSFFIDSSATLASLNEFRRNCAFNEKECCMSFYFKADSAYQDMLMNVSVNYPAKSRAGAPNGKKVLWIQLFPDGEVGGFSGGYVSSTETDRENADSVVFVFLKRANGLETAEEKKKPGYEPVRLILMSSSEEIGYLDKRITDIVKGYIYFLREETMLLFDKPIDSLSVEEKTKLISAFPLSISIGYNK